MDNSYHLFTNVRDGNKCRYLAKNITIVTHSHGNVMEIRITRGRNAFLVIDVNNSILMH